MSRSAAPRHDAENSDLDRAYASRSRVGLRVGAACCATGSPSVTAGRSLPKLCASVRSWPQGRTSVSPGSRLPARYRVPGRPRVSSGGGSRPPALEQPGIADVQAAPVRVGAVHGRLLVIVAEAHVQIVIPDTCSCSTLPLCASENESASHHGKGRQVGGRNQQPYALVLPSGRPWTTRYAGAALAPSGDP